MRTKKSSSAWIVPASLLVIITMICIGAVEGFYFYLGNRLQAQPAEQVEQAGKIVRESREVRGQSPESETGEQTAEGEVDIAVITRRNLFASQTGDQIDGSRSNPLESLEPSSLEVVLMGTIAGPDNEQRAVIYDIKDRRQDLYQQGDYIQQAAIKQILRGKVILSIDGRDEVLDIAEARKVPVAQGTPVAPVMTSEPVVGRPVGTPPPAQPPPRQEVARPPAGSKVVLPQSGNPQVIRSIRQPDPPQE